MISSSGFSHLVSRLPVLRYTTTLRPLISWKMSITAAMINSRWIKLPPTPPINPNNQSTTSKAIIVHNIVFPPLNQSPFKTLNSGARFIFSISLTFAPYALSESKDRAVALKAVLCKAKLYLIGP